MTLRLSIENVSSLSSGDPTEMVLNEHGLVIGRAAHADWTLPDPRNHVSSLHAEIDFVDGGYVLTDRSTNGTFVNGGAARLTVPYRLRTGDLVTIGPYEVRATVTVGEMAGGGAASSAFGGGTGGGLDWLSAAGGTAGRVVDPGAFGRDAARPLFQSSGDPLMSAFAPPAAAPSSAPPAADPFGLGGASAAPPVPAADPFGLGPTPARAPMPAHAPPPPAPPAPTHDPFGLGGGASAPPAADPFGLGGAAATPAPPIAPAATPAGGDVWAKLHAFDAIDFGAAAGAPPVAAATAPVAVNTAPTALSAAPATTSSTGGELFDRFLAAAGLKPKDMGDATPAAVLEAAGRLLRQTADGLIRLLDARARIRHQFGVGAQVTSFQREGNNPLKWTRSPEQALRQLVGEPDPGFLHGPMAVQGAFEDLQAHEVAMLAAMQEALGATVERFSPDAIRARVATKGGLLPGSREAALWRAFEAEFRALATESEAAYLDMFARHFRKAYERNIKREGS